MARYRCTLAYDGTVYHGFQRQSGSILTVQSALEHAIERVTQQQINITAAGRTDSGVHAVGQVIAFDAVWRSADALLMKAINANLPDDIALQDIRQHEGFHPRFDALSRSYHYTILVTAQRQPFLAKYSWQLNNPLELDAMQQAASMLIGEHDFAAFGNPPQGTNTVREMFRSNWSVEAADYGYRYIYNVEANAFLYNMVRRIVGTLVSVGRKTLSVTEFDAIFRSADLAQAKVLAPPQGLVFQKVRYPDKTEFG